MKLYGRYVLVETTAVCVVAVVGFVGILLAANAVRDIVEWVAMGRLTLADTAEVLRILIPSAVSYALPLGTMTGILIVVGRMSAQNEILAMKSIGIGLGTIVRPIFLLAAGGTLFSAYVNLYHAPDSTGKYRQFFRKIIVESPMRFIAPKTLNDYFHGCVIYVDSLVDGHFNAMKIWQFAENNLLEMYISARSGTINFDEQSDAFLLKLNDGNAESFSEDLSPSGVRIPQIMAFKNISIKLPASEFIGAAHSTQKKFRHMALGELLEAKKTLNSNKSLPRSEIRHGKTLINMQISSHVANAFGIFVMALLAIPLGVKTNRSDTALNIGIALSLCLGYYLAMVMLALLGENTRLRPDILIWAPNVALMALGFSLFNRATRH
jgi:lipopolysaccharide export system permease protein